MHDKLRQIVQRAKELDSQLRIVTSAANLTSLHSARLHAANQRLREGHESERDWCWCFTTTTAKQLS